MQFSSCFFYAAGDLTGTRRLSASQKHTRHHIRR